MKNSTILRKAKKLIQQEKQMYICFAIYEVLDSCSSEKSETGPLILWIQDLLEGYNTLSSWLIRKLRINPYTETSKLKATRIAWLDWMIAYWESQGN